MDTKTIVIGMPCYGEVPPEILEDFGRFLHWCGRFTSHRYFLAIRSKAEQFRARNSIVEAAVQLNADYLFFLDDDMVINAHNEQGVSSSYAVIERLMAVGADIAGGLYFQRQGACSPVAMRATGDKAYRFLRPEELEQAPQPVDVVGGGCMLINMRIFDKIKPPYFEPESTVDLGTDVQICRKALAAGYTVMLDPTTEVGHLRNERVVVSSANRMQFMSDYLPGEVKKQFVASGIYSGLFSDAAEWTNLKSYDEMSAAATEFHKAKAGFNGSDIDWYRCFPTERVARQVWLNTHQHDKRAMVEYLIGAILASKTKDPILEFGCGIGVSAFALAQAGHNVTACDVRGTGPLEFLKWRTFKHGVKMTFHETMTETPHLGSEKFGIIIAMDVLEHLPGWRDVLAYLVDRLLPGGILFCNNAVLDDPHHVEHYDLRPADFIEECKRLGLTAFNQIGYIKEMTQ